MNGLIPTPDPLGAPSPTIIFQLLGWLTLVLHFAFMNFILGGTLIVTIQEWLFGHRPVIARANSLMLKTMPVALSMAITMGVAPLLFVQVLHGQFFYSANIMMGWYWMAILGLVTVAFYLIYVLISLRPLDGRATLLSRLIVLVNAAIFITVSLIFTNNATLVEHPELWAKIHAGELSPLVMDTKFWMRWSHTVFGALAVAGLWCSGIGLFQKRYHAANREAGEWMYRNGLYWAKSGVFLAMIVGFIYLFTLGGDTLKNFMGNGFMFVGWAVSVCTAFVGLALMVMATIKKDQPKYYWAAVAVVFITLFGMVMGRDLLRYIALEPYYTLSDLTVRPHVSSLALFLGTFVIGLLILAYMIRLLWTVPGDPPTDGAPQETPAAAGESIAAPVEEAAAAVPDEPADEASKVSDQSDDSVQKEPDEGEEPKPDAPQA
ncbi:MAG: hypothetical protein GC154_06710 [bacterium]|nr:hypothetical protein [bacterium]